MGLTAPCKGRQAGQEQAAELLSCLTPSLLFPQILSALR